MEAVVVYGPQSPVAADCSGSDRPGETDETIAAERPVHGVEEVVVAAECTSPVPSVAVVDDICARCCLDRSQGQ